MRSREELLRFSREIAFAAARVYASAAETRGSWDARLEALVIDGLVRGVESSATRCRSRLAALGWRETGPITAVVGSAPTATPPRPLLAACTPGARRLGIDAMAGVHGDRLVVVSAASATPPRPPADCCRPSATGPWSSARWPSTWRTPVRSPRPR